MAHKYERPNSPFWWMKTTARTPGRFSTNLRIGRKEDTEKAEEMEAQLTLEERRRRSVRSESQFSTWVEEHLRTHYHNKGTLKRVMNAWTSVSTFLHQNGILGPEQVTRDDCKEFFTWRMERGARKGSGKQISRNTVILELKIFGMILMEAVNRGWIEHNVAHRLGIKRAPAKERAEMTDEQVAIIRAELVSRVANAVTEAEKRNADFLFMSFEIALAQGIRLSETRLNMRQQVNLMDMEITMHAKGGRDFIAPINPDLVPLLEKCVAEKRQWTYEIPTKNVPNLLWMEVFQKLRAKHPSMNDVSFHSTRVRFISKLERGGISDSVVMKVVNHASTTVHRIYRKVKRSEMSGAWNALRAPSEQPPREPRSEGEPTDHK